MAKEHLVVVIGGGVAGSEAIAQLYAKNVSVVCIEQNALPYGKIEDGLPRWHVEQRKKESEKIDQKLGHSVVYFVPKTRLGKDLTFEEIYKEWKPSAVILANGAWKDRSLSIPGIDQYIGNGLAYQNPLVYWFNHYSEPNYKGPKFDIPDRTIVIGGGLASLDVMKICQLEITKKALQKRKIEADVLELEKEGIPAVLRRHSLTFSDLGLYGTTLFYRRRLQDMPLAEIPQTATPEQMEKQGALREKIIHNFRTKYLFHFVDCHIPTAPIVKEGKLAGLKMAKTKVEGKKSSPIPGTEENVEANLVIGSIGSIPYLIPGIPTRKETYDVKDLDTGEINGMPGLYATGNAVTGKGNIRVSLLHGRQVALHVAEQIKPISEAQRDFILQKVKTLQERVGYLRNDYGAWIEKNRP